ncbi:MAG: endonuclease [Alloprevotella sp.]|nr:endonuclease [Alloprevotella sp.]
MQKNFKVLLFVFVVTFCVSANLHAQDKLFRIVEYNVENLFDTIHQEGLNDQEFTPTGSHRWDSRRYWSKQDRLLRTIVACGGIEPPAIVVMCEVENDSVLADLTRHTRLAMLGYEFVATQGSDPRGINVALLYQPIQFKPLRVERLQVNTPHNPLGSTRDILYVSGLVPTLDTLDLYCVHLPSRSGGQTATDKRRTEAVSVVAAHIDRERQRGRRPNHIVLGDFNDEWHNNCIRKTLKAIRPKGDIDREANYVLTARMKAAHGIRGTYYFQRQWSQLDNIVVAGSLLDPSARFHTRPENCRIGAFDFLLEHDRMQRYKPRRNYLGTHYHGGYSDHLPLLLDFVCKPVGEE